MKYDFGDAEEDQYCKTCSYVISKGEISTEHDTCGSCGDRVAMISKATN